MRLRSMLTREGFLVFAQWDNAISAHPPTSSFPITLPHRHFALLNVSTTLSRITLIATLARVSRVVLEYSSSEPYDSPLYAPGVVDASSSPRFPRVVPHLPPAQSVFSQPLIAGPPALFWPFWAELCRPVVLHDDQDLSASWAIARPCYQRGV